MLTFKQVHTVQRAKLLRNKEGTGKTKRLIDKNTKSRTIIQTNERKERQKNIKKPEHLTNKETDKYFSFNKTLIVTLHC